MDAASSYRRAVAFGSLLPLLAACVGLHGAQLPLHRYTTADGLASNTINDIVSDSRGFLWFATSEGLSRFDGYSFSNLTTLNGLPHRSVSRVLVDRSGVYWIGTPNGLVRFHPERPESSPDRLVVFRPDGPRNSPVVNDLLEDRTGRIWVGTLLGVFSVDPNPANARLAAVDVGMPGKIWEDSVVNALEEDSEGAIWMGMGDGTLYRRLPSGRVEHYAAAEGFPASPTGSGPFSSTAIQSLLCDRQGRIWVGTVDSLCRLIPHPRTGANIIEDRPGKREGLPQTRVHTLFESKNGDIWAGMFRALAQFPHDGGPVRVWKRNDGLPGKSIISIAEDHDGNLWLGTDDLGTVKLAGDGFVSFSQRDGIGGNTVSVISETPRGVLYMVGRYDDQGHLSLSARQGERFTAVQPRVPKGIRYFGWRPARVVLQDHTGEWWLAALHGLCRYPRLDNPLELARVPPKAVYSSRDGLPNDEVIRLYEDRGGTLWIGTGARGVTFWDRREDRFRSIGGDVMDRASSIGEDDAGNVWIGDESGRLWRVQHQRVSPVGAAAEGRGWINDFLLDHSGRLWVATGNKGLLRFDHPAAAQPEFRKYDQADGLSSANIRCLVEDRQGFILFGTSGGIDRLNPDSGHVQHYSTAEGVAPGQVVSAYRDREGAIWFGTTYGLTRLGSETHPPHSPPSVWITGISIGGRPMEISNLGESKIREFEIPPGRQQIQVDFVAVSYASGNLPRYQYRTGDGPWSPPMQSRSVHYGALEPGRYQFEVRAVNAEGDVSPAPAVVLFRVMPPVWRRAWFLGLLLALAVGGVVWVHRMRVAKLLALERVRTRIATDLHDDIGSSLSQIAILSEAAQRRSAGSETGAALERIGGLSRELMDSISDTVWAIQPHKDHLTDLKQRMRRFATEVLSARNVEMRWTLDDAGRDLQLDAELRRQVYLIFKEAVHNIARHSRATETHIALKVQERQLTLEVKDNGRGIERWEDGEGNGLKSMKLRAAKLRGELEIRSAQGQGTTVILITPLPV